MALGKLIAGLARSVGGGVAVEFSLLTPIVVYGAIAVIDYMGGAYRQMQVQEAAQVGAQYAVIHGFDADAVSQAVLGATTYSVAANPAPETFCACLSARTLSRTTCGSTCSDGRAAGSYVSAYSSATYTTALSYPSIPTSFALHGQATVRIK